MSKSGIFIEGELDYNINYILKRKKEYDNKLIDILENYKKNNYDPKSIKEDDKKYVGSSITKKKNIDIARKLNFIWAVMVMSSSNKNKKGKK